MHFDAGRGYDNYYDYHIVFDQNNKYYYVWWLWLKWRLYCNDDSDSNNDDGYDSDDNDYDYFDLYCDDDDFYSDDCSYTDYYYVSQYDDDYDD